MIASTRVKVVASTVAVVAGGLLLASCDESHSFTFFNETSDTVQIAWSLELEDDPRPLDHDVHLVMPGEEVSTGAMIFYNGRVLSVQATSNEMVILNKVYTYKELKDIDFRIEIQPPEPP